MTPSQVAKILGCATSTIKAYINSGKIVATITKIPGGFVYNISDKEVSRIKKQPKNTFGRPRGSKTKKINNA